MTYTSLLNYRGLTSGGSPTAAVYAADFTTEVAGQTAVALSEKPPNSGNYNAQLTLSDSGGYIVITDGSNVEVEAYGPQAATQSALAVVDGIVDEILLDTAEIGAAGAGLTAVPWNAAWDAQVESEVVDGLTVYTAPTTAQFEARTLLAANYFDFQTDQVIVATNNDKTGYSLTQAFPTNFATLAIDGTGHVTAGNMRGTDNALLSTSYVAPLSAMDVRSAVGLAAANLDTQLGGIPTVAAFEARTLPAGDYFNPATDTVATVTTLTNLPGIPANWLTASGLASDAVAEIQTGLATTANQTSILAGLTDIKGPTFSAATDSLEAIRDRGDVSWTTATGFSTHTAADVWAVGTRTVTGGTIDTNLDMRGTDNALLAEDYTAPNNTSIVLALSAAQAAAQAAQAMADGESGWDASTSTAYIKNADGTARKTFDLKNADGEPADPTTEPVAKRIPRP